MLKFVIIFAFFLLFAGCTFQRLEKDLVEYDTYRNIEGELIDSSTGEAPIILFYFNTSSGQRKLESFSYQPQAGKFFSLYRGESLQLFAYKDLNGNLAYDSTEPAVLSPTYYFSDSLDTFPSITLVLRESEHPLIDSLPTFSKSEFAHDSSDSWVNGEIVSIESLRFSQHNANLAYWEPMSFVDSIRGGLFFEHTYDSSKIPILFVHGAGGSPKDFEDIVEDLDTTIYQPWYYFYPSGLRLEVAVEVLNRLLNKQYQLLEFKEIILVAHSMGGLVARGYLQQNLDPEAFAVPLFITLSTPWAGHAGAQAGIDMAPAIVPSWIDMAPHSAFIQDLFKEPLISSVSHYLLFGVKGGTSRFTGTNDETVSIASEIYLPAQEQAQKIYGFNETHTSILSSDESRQVIRSILYQYASASNQ